MKFLIYQQETVISFLLNSSEISDNIPPIVCVFCGFSLFKTTKEVMNIKLITSFVLKTTTNYLFLPVEIIAQRKPIIAVAESCGKNLRVPGESQ